MPNQLTEELRGLRERATELKSRFEAAAGPNGASAEGSVSDCLQRSVIRPLSDALRRRGPESPEPVPAAGGGRGQTAGGDGGAAPESPTERLWQLAEEATRLRLTSGTPTEIQEAAAALQALATGPGAEAADRLDRLRQLMAQLPAQIQSQSNGPYLVTNVERLTDGLGEALPTRPQMALCRCGKSSLKPFCDGTHAEIGFNSAKDPGRLAGRRDRYPGQQVTVLDNRAICQHAGYCSDRLATVFRVGEEPFVAPSGGRMDEIIRAVRDCPSGALSYAIDEHEARDQVDHGMRREPAIEVTNDGPYRIVGAIALSDASGEDEAREAGASREHYALCRCGQSQNKPFCSGMHWYVEFKDPPRDPDAEPTIFAWAGGLPALTRMTRVFYEKYVPQDPLLGPLFANMSPDHPERVAKWLAEVFGGPERYSKEYGGYPRMLSQHIGKGLTEDKRARWVQLILRSAKDAGLPADPEFRSAFSSYIEWGSRLALENSQPGAKPPEHMPMPHWDWTTAAGPPGSRAAGLQPATDEDPPISLPPADEPVSFEKHIKTMFRHRDRQSMKFVFDLWAYDDVKRNAHAIGDRLADGSMPCDGAWPQDQVAAFQRWVESGMRP